MSIFQKILTASIAVFSLLAFSLYTETGAVNAEARAVAASVPSVFRIRTDTPHGNYRTIGHGTAFSIDLSEFGTSRHRYVLTACHVVRDKNGAIVPEMKVELSPSNTWVSCRIVSMDPKLDVALLECAADLPSSTRLASNDAPEGRPIVMIGSPAGSPLRAISGTVAGRKLTNWSSAHVDFIAEGCSGGPVFDAATRRIAGLTVAGIGIGNPSHMDRHTCLYVPESELRRFVRNALHVNGVAPRNNVLRNPQPRCLMSPRPDENATVVDRSGMWIP